MLVYYRPDDLYVRVVLLDPPFAYGRQATIIHPQRGECRVGLSTLDLEV